MADDNEHHLLEELRAQRAALADFGLFAFRCNDVDDVLTRACELVSEALHVELVKVAEHLPERGEMVLRSGVNWQPGVVGNVTFPDDARSPGGYAMLTEEAVVSPDVEKEDRFEIPDVLVRHGVKSMVNVLIAGEQRPFGILEVDAKEKRDFGEDEVIFLRTYANLLAAAIDRIAAHEELARAAREQHILARELQHRGRNLLALVQGLVSLHPAEGRTAESLREGVLGQLRALAAAERVIFDDGSAESELRRVAEDVLAPFREAERSIEIDGPSVRLPARSGRMIGLALHELATNAIKHGAMSAAAGQVRLEWRILERDDGREVALSWNERGGHRVSDPERRGFGRRLLEEIVGGELRGEADLSLEPEGLQYRLSFPIG